MSLKLRPLFGAEIHYPKRWLPTSLQDRIRTRMQYTNAAFFKAKRVGQMTDALATVNLFRESKAYLILPRHTPWKELALPPPSTYCRFRTRTAPEMVRAAFTGSLRKYQHDAFAALVDRLHDRDDGIIALRCGYGKTVLALGAWAHTTPGPMIAVMPTLFLVNQWKERILEFTDVREREIGLIAEGRAEFEGKTIVLATLKSLVEKGPHLGEGFRDYFDVVFFDECVDSTALVETAAGPKPLGDINTNDVVLSFNETSNAFEFQRVTRTWNKGIKPTLRVNTRLGSLSVTPEHLFLTSSGKWVPAQRLQPGQLITCNVLPNSMRLRHSVPVTAVNDCLSAQSGWNSTASRPFDGPNSLVGTTEENQNARISTVFYRWFTGLCSVMEVLVSPMRLQPLGFPLITVAHRKRGHDIKLSNLRHYGLASVSEKIGDTVQLLSHAFRSRTRDYVTCLKCADPKPEKKSRLSGWIKLLMRRWRGGSWMTGVLVSRHCVYTPKGITDQKCICLPDGSGSACILESSPTKTGVDGSCYLIEPHQTHSWIRSNASSPIACPTNVEVLSVEQGLHIPVADIEVEKNHNFVANGMVVHNCHRLGAEYFSKAAHLINATRIGLSATWKREDGMEALFTMHIGDVFFADTKQALTPKVFFVRTPTRLLLDGKFRLRGYRELNYARITTALSRDPARHQFIVTNVLAAVEEGRKILVLGDRKEELAELDVLLRAKGVDAAICVGSLEGRVMSHETRADALSRQVILATSQLVKEGLDKKDIDTLFILYPQSNATFAEQATGRILREDADKLPPVVIVMFDDKVSTPTDKKGRNFQPYVARCKKMEDTFKRLKYDIVRPVDKPLKFGATT